MVTALDCDAGIYIQLCALGVMVVCAIVALLDGYKAGKLPTGMAAFSPANYTRTGCWLVIVTALLALGNALFPLIWAYACK